MLRSLFATALFALSALAAAAAAAAAAPIPAPPAVPARAYLLEDYQTGQVLGSDHADDRMEPASLTKLMTAYIVFTTLHDGRLKLTDPVTISEHAWRSEGSRTFIQVGTQIPVDILIKGMIVQSGNDATVALAERVAGTETPPPTLYVQAGAFAVPANAAGLQQRLQQAGLSSAVVLPPQPGHHLYRVRLGPVNTVADFDALAARLATLGVPDARLALD